MKVVTYHYVRTENPDLPYFHYLDAENFRKQVEYFAANGGLVTPEELERYVAGGPVPKNKFLLTFDDGLTDHLQSVAPTLLNYGSAGLFFISSGPLLTGEPLAVHVAHVLLGRCNPATLLNCLIRNMSASDLQSETAHAKALTYKNQENVAEITQFKRLINYQIKPEASLKLLKFVAAELYPDAFEDAKKMYLDRDQIAKLVDMGFVAGGHTVNHWSLARLPTLSWQREIRDSFAYINEIANGRCLSAFAYPFGGSHNYPGEAKDFLQSLGCKIAMDVRAEDADQLTLHKHRYSFPRYDCNMFEFGAVSGGYRAAS